MNWAKATSKNGTIIYINLDDVSHIFQWEYNFTIVFKHDNKKDLHVLSIVQTDSNHMFSNISDAAYDYRKLLEQVQKDIED